MIVAAAYCQLLCRVVSGSLFRPFASSCFIEVCEVEIVAGEFRGHVGFPPSKVGTFRAMCADVCMMRTLDSCTDLFHFIYLVIFFYARVVMKVDGTN